jgi:hypothetical protein
MWAYRSKGVRIFPNDLQAHFRSDTLGSPATSRVINPAKTLLILKHQSKLPPSLPLPPSFLLLGSGLLGLGLLRLRRKNAA